MKHSLHWYDFITINSYGLGMGVSAGILTSVLFPYLIVLFMPVAEKTTHLSTLRWVGLTVAMFVQPLAGMLSDRSTLRWGRRRPFISIGALFNLLFLAVIAFSSNLKNANSPVFGVPLAFVVLLGGVILLQISSNIAQGAFQGLIPDLVPENQRGRAAGVKSVMDLLPIFLVIFVGPLVDKGYVWLVIAIIMGSFGLTLTITSFFVHEEPLTEKPTESIRGPALRLAGLTAIFVVVTQLSVWLVKVSGTYLGGQGASVGLQVVLVGAAGLVAMAGSIFLGVYLGAWVGIGADASRHTGFIWWVISRLLFLAAIGSIQGFASYYLKDVVWVENPALMTTILLASVAVFLIPAALVGGYLADRLGRQRLLAWAGFIAAGGTLLLLLSGAIFPLIIVSGCIIGLGTGLFFATNWALGTDLVPPEAAGKYLGISNLAGAGAGIAGAGIGGPMADFFNLLSPGLGYIVIFSLYGLLFLLSVAALRQIK
jgi:MFS family permease